MLQDKKINHHIEKNMLVESNDNKNKNKKPKKIQNKDPIHGNKLPCKKVNRDLNVVNHHFLPHFSFKIIKKNAYTHTLILTYRLYNSNLKEAGNRRILGG